MAEKRMICEGDIRLIPVGGSTGQVLAKKSTTAWDVEWVNGGSSNVDWNNISNKPSTFPPSQHTHNEYAKAVTTGGLGDDSSLDDIISKINTLISQLKGQ